MWPCCHWLLPLLALLFVVSVSGGGGYTSADSAFVQGASAVVVAAAVVAVVAQVCPNVALYERVLVSI